MIPTLPPEAAQAGEQHEEANRSSTTENVMDGVDGAVDLAQTGVIEAVGHVAGACLDGVTTVAQVSAEVVGGILGGLTEL